MIEFVTSGCQRRYCFWISVVCEMFTLDEEAGFVIKVACVHCDVWAEAEETVGSSAVDN